MKRKLFIIGAISLIFGACTKNIENLNDQTKKPTDVPPSALFANAQKNLVDIMTSPSVNYNIFRLNVQWWTETTYLDESNYDLSTRNIPQSFWNSLYRDVLYNLQDAKRRIPTQDPQFNTPGQMRNEMAMADIMQIYAWSVLVNTFGNVPYTQAMDIDRYPTPVYDDAKTIYYDLLTRLDTSITALGLNTAEPAFGVNDLLYGSDITQWLKFGNSLKLKLAMVIADIDAPKAKTLIEAAAPHVFTSLSDNATLVYKESPPNVNQIWVELVQSGRHDFVIGQTFADSLETLDDPRLPLYMTKDAAGGYSGGVIGKSSKFATYSKPVDKIQQPTFEALLLDYPEVELLLAEAAARNMSVGGTVQSHYDAGVTASVIYWGGTTADAATYLTTGKGNYNTLPGTFREKIGLQKWIALYNRGFDAWVDVRRLDYPKMAVPNAPKSGFPMRYTYPAQEQTLNTANYEKGSGDIGGDEVSTKLFWDIN